MKHLCRENYQAAANAALKFPPFPTELVKAVTCQVKKELQNLQQGKIDSEVRWRPPELENFQERGFIRGSEGENAYHECHCDCDKQSPDKISHLPRSNFIYRINTLLTAGCCKTEVMDLLHRLGLSSHPNTIRAQLQSSSDHFDKEIMAWRSQIERNRKQIKLLDEVITTQTSYQSG